LAISGPKHFVTRNVVPKSPKMARPQDALSSDSPRLPGAEAGVDAVADARCAVDSELSGGGTLAEMSAGAEGVSA